MESPTWAPPGIDTETPSAARVYDYMLGGSHNFAVDRAVAEQALAVMPEVRAAGRHNRAFLRRAVQHLIAAGIRQFVDLGSGIAAVGSVHEVAWQLDPSVRLVYVDLDPVAVAYNEHLLAGDDRAAVLDLDLRDVDAVLGDPRLTGRIDLSAPVGLLMVAVLHNLPDTDDPYGVVAAYRDRLAAGSYLVASHATPPPGMPAPSAAAQEQYNRTDNQLILRDAAAFERFFAGFDVVEPGVMHASDWRPDQAPPPGEGVAAAMTVAAVGRLRSAVAAERVVESATGVTDRRA
jgi:hypothetical protein